ncbi:MAG: sensor histidine kinase [Candidatus Hodarchaeota archaeon]
MERLFDDFFLIILIFNELDIYHNTIANERFEKEMLGILFLIIHVAIYSAMGTLFYSLRARLSLIPFYLYLGALEVLVSIMNSIYLFEINIFGTTILLGGGNIVYSAVVWCVTLLYIMERDPELIQFVIYCLVALQVLFLFLYPFFTFILEDPLTISPLSISPDLFRTSFWIFLIGNFLQLVELFGMVILIEKASKIDRLSNIVPWQVWVILVYIFVLILDGILFPLLAFPVTQSISVVQGIQAIIGKFLLGVLFSAAFLIVIFLLKAEFTEKSKEPDFNILRLVSLPKLKMVRRIRTAEENEAMIRLLLDLLSHDIKNYNTTSIGYVDLLIDHTEQDENSKEMLEQIKRIQTESATLVKNVLNLNKIQEKVLQPEDVELKRMFEKAVSNIRGTYPNIPLGIQNEESLKNIYVTVHSLLAEIFYNILTNSIKYRKQDQEIVEVDLTLREEGEKIYLSIGDKGRGIPDERKEEVFKRLDKTPYKKGIGLYIVKSILIYFGCDIWVENRPEAPYDHKEGSVFQLVFPKTKESVFIP